MSVCVSMCVSMCVGGVWEYMCVCVCMHVHIRVGMHGMHEYV